ncbi:MAG: hypothetical protein R3A11_02040 [Bdellovibrionota bacterium]
MTIKTLTKNIGTGMLLSLLCLGHAWGCSFKAEGVTTSNQEKFLEALRSITSEVEFTLETGTIHFTSKDAVTSAQVEKALQGAKLTDIHITSITH